ncbi:MAG: glycosyltransferase [Dehalococcoidia bacterium]
MHRDFRRWFRLVAVLLAPAAQLWFLHRGERVYAALPSLGHGCVPAEDRPLVSIIVPARNEAQNLRRLLPSLTHLTHRQTELIVVDDNSTDDTARIARNFGARLLFAGPLPSGWVGKSHACWVGARAASSDWLLFTDADTWHAPTSLGRALAHALDGNLAALSLLTKQECNSFWASLLLPFAYQHYFAGLRPDALTDRRSRAVLLNGQYVLVQRAVYDRCGGHAAVRGSLIEDAALGALFKHANIPFETVHSEGAVHVRMYQGLAGIWEGFSKNSARFLAADPAGGGLTALSTASAGAASLLVVQGIISRRSAALVAGLISYLIAVIGLGRWQCRFGAPVILAWLQPLAAAVFQVIAFNSAYRATTRTGARWKGRVYRI